MKLKLTQTYTAKKTTCGALVKSGQMHGLYVEKGDVKVSWVWNDYSWIQQNRRRVIYLLEDEEIDAVWDE